MGDEKLRWRRDAQFAEGLRGVVLGSTRASHAREFVTLALILDAGATTALGETSALDDDQSSAGGRSAPTSLLHS